MSSTKGTNANKDVIYIDVDDEITGIIDKVKDSDKKIVALVLPKRATVLQSIVNMKLLKRAATDSKKNLVLITSEAGLAPLAGNVGLHVAKSLSSKPEIPDRPTDKSDDVEEVEEGEIRLDGRKTVGELSGVTPYADGPDAEEDPIELDDDESMESIETEGGASKKTRNKKFKIPNFNKFRLMLILGGVAVLLLSMVGYAALAVWPKAKITIKTNSEAVNASVILTLKTPAETKLDAEKGIIRAEIQEVKKTVEQQVPATGQQNNGEKATGTVVMKAKNCTSLSTPSDVPAGTGLTTGGKTYITQDKANFGGSGVFDGSCLIFTDNNVSIAAREAGSGYNVNSATFAVAGRADVSATGSTSGGTDDIVKVVSQADIDAAKQKITEQDTQPITQELKSALIGRGLYAMDATMSVGTPETKMSAEVGAPAETVAITQTINYTMYGVKLAELEEIIEKSVDDKIDTKKQSIIDYGLDEAVFSIQGITPDGASVSMQTTAVAGTELDTEAIKKQVAGKKAGDAKEIISANPGVTDVNVEYSPFWVGSIPKKTDKITVIVQEPKVAEDDETSSP